MSLVMATLCYRLVVAAPSRPRQHLLDRRKRPPGHAPQETPDCGDREGDEGDQLGDGIGVGPVSGRV
jgi:hypothetical protein